MSRVTEPKLRLVRGGAEAARDERWLRQIGWQAGPPPALPDDYEDRLAARIFGGGEVISLEAAREGAPIEHDVVDPSAGSARSWLAAVALVMLLVGSLAATTRPFTSAAIEPAPEREIAPVREPDAPEGEPSESEPAQADRSDPDPRRDERLAPAPPDPGAAPRALVVVASASPAPRGVATETRDGPVTLVDGARPDGARETRRSAAPIDPDGEPPPIALRDLVEAAGLPRLGGTSPELTAARPTAIAVGASLRDHLAAAGHEGEQMAVVDLVGAGRHLVGRL